MGAATAIGIGAGVNVIGGVAKAVSGARNARRARRAIQNYQRQELTNAYQNLQVSRLGADLQREELARTAATGVQALRGAGTRGLVGGLGALTAQQNLQNRQIAANLDEQQQGINRLVAQDDATIRGLQERREEADLAGLGQQLNVGRQDLYSGIGDVGSSLGSIGNLARAGAFGGQGGQAALPQVGGVNSLSPMGLLGMGGNTMIGNYPTTTTLASQI